MRRVRATLMALWGGALVFAMSGGFLLFWVPVGDFLLAIHSGCALAVAVAAYTFWDELHE